MSKPYPHLGARIQKNTWLNQTNVIKGPHGLGNTPYSSTSWNSTLLQPPLFPLANPSNFNRWFTDEDTDLSNSGTEHLILITFKKHNK